MAVTRSRAAGRRQTRRAGKGWRSRELVALLLAGALVALGLHLVYQAKATGLAEAAQGLAARRLLNLNELSAREDLLPALGMIADAPARREGARQTYSASGSLANVGALARIRGLLTTDQFRQLKPLFVVRRPERFESAFYRWAGAFFLGFLLVHEIGR